MLLVAGGQRAAIPQSAGPDELTSCLDKADELMDSLDKKLDDLLKLADSVFVQHCDRTVTGKVTVTETLEVIGEADVTEVRW